MISLGLVFFGFGTKDSPLLRTSIAAFVSILLLRLTSDFLLYASGLIARYIHKLRWDMQDVKSVSSLLSCFSCT